MSISANGKVIVAATKDLSLRWTATKECWQDAKSEEFERIYFDELLSSVDKAAEVFDQLDRLVAKVRSDCE
jgi:hypothetical protein